MASACQKLLLRLTCMKSEEEEGWVKVAIDTLAFSLTYLAAKFTFIGFGVSVFMLYIRGINTRPEAAVATWGFMEIVFYLYCRHAEHTHLKPRPGLKTTDSRRRKILSELLDDDDLVKNMVGWFNPYSKAMVTRNQAKDFLAWFFYGQHDKILNPGQNLEIEDSLSYMERHRGINFAPHQTGVPRKLMKLNTDKLPIQHKPLVFYMVILTIHCITWFGLYFLGFQRFCIVETGFTYWIYRPQKQDATKEPVFFVHGIGLGLTPYFKKITQLVRIHPNRQLILLELPYISLLPALRVQSVEETIQSIDAIFSTHNIQKCSWVSHSYGSYVVSWVVQRRPEYCHKITMVDPVCFAFWNPALIRNFMYITSNSFVHRMTKFFVSQDLFISHTISRNFNLHYNLLLPEDLKQCQTHVYLSKYDFIIDAPAIHQYLEKSKQRDPTLNLEITTIDEFTHGAYLLSTAHSKAFLELI